MKFPVPRRFEGNHRVVELLALGTQNGLDDDVPAAIRAARYAGAITAFGTFEEIRAAHKPFIESLSRVMPVVTQFGGARLPTSRFARTLAPPKIIPVFAFR